MTAKRFKFNGATNCIEYDGKSILLDSYGEDIEELLNELHEENEQLKTDIRLHIDDSEKYRKLSLQFDNRNKELISENVLLEKENEQLKKRLMILEDKMKGLMK